jgi:prevent-host-death family protein
MVESTQEHVDITHNGEPAAVLVSAQTRGSFGSRA